MNLIIGIAGLIIRATALVKAFNLLRYSKNYRVLLLICLILAFFIHPIVNLGFSAEEWGNLPFSIMMLYVGTSLLAFASAHFLGYYVKQYTRSNRDFRQRLAVFDQFISSSPVLYFIIAEGKIVYCNPATVLVSEYSEEELFDNKYNTIIHPEDHSILEIILEEQDEENTTTQKTIRIQSKKGATRWLHATFTSVSYNDKPAIAASAQDITQQIKTERILLKAEERLRFAVEATDLVVWDCDPIADRIKLESTPSTFPVKNYPEFFSFNAFLKHVDPRDKKRIAKAHKAIINTNKRFQVDFRVLIPGSDSEWWHMEGRSFAGTASRPARIIGTSRNIQSQKKAREVIKKNESVIRFQADLLANIGQMIIAQNTKGEIVYWNEEAKKLVGEYADDSLPFDPDKYNIPSQYRIIHNEEIMESLRAGKQWSGERKAYLLNGEIIPLHVNVSPFSNKMGELEGFILIGTDLTEYKKIQAELKSSEEQLQLQMHQLQAIYTMAEIMKEAEDLAAIYKAATEGVSLVSDIDRIAILMLDEDNQLTFTYAHNIPANYQAILLEHCTWINDTQANEDVYISDVQSSSTCSKLAQSFADEGIRSLAAFPLLHQNRILGKMITFWKEPVCLVPVKTQILRRIADQLAIAIVKKKAEIQLKHRTNELQTIADNIPDQIIRLDSNYKLLFANKATRERTTLSQKNLSDLEHFFSTKKTISLWRTKLGNVFNKGTMQEFEYETEQNGNGSPRHYQAIVVPEKPTQETQANSLQSVVGIIRDTTENRQLQKFIVDMNARQQRKIGQDLHDELGQLLTGIGFLIAGLKKDFEEHNDSKEDLDKISELVEKSIAQTRILAEGLNPVTLELHGLITSLQRLAIHTEKLYNITCSFRSNAAIEEISDETAYQMYRIVQEAITNSVKHGNPTLISVTLHHNEHNLILQIIDNGKGIDPVKFREGGQGMQIMKYRTRMINGELTIDSTPSEGTTVTCIIPYTENR